MIRPSQSPWWGIVQPAGPLLGLLLASVLLEVVAVVSVPLIVREMFYGPLATDPGYLRLLLGGCGAIVFATLISRLGIAWTLSGAAAQILSRVQTRVFREVCSRPDGAEIVADASADLTKLEAVLTFPALQAVRGALTTAAALLCMLFMSWWLTLLAAVAVGVVGVLLQATVRPTRHAARARESAARGMAGILGESIEGRVVLRAYGLSDWWDGRFAARRNALRRATRREILMAQLEAGTVAVGVLLVLCLALGVGTLAAQASALSVASFAGYLGMFFPLAVGLQQLRMAAGPIEAAQDSAARLGALLERSPGAPVVIDGGAASPLREAIRFEGVGLWLPGLAEATSGLDLEIPAGRSVALVGSSGSGKSQVLHLILGLAKTGGGRITWDGAPLDGRQLSQLGVVFETTVLFRMSVAANIRLGHVDATSEEVEAAARAADVDQTILALPHGYDTLIGKGGVPLGAETRQRIGIARAIVRSPGVLLLDEPTASLDPHEESQVRETLQRLSTDRTVIHVTHRILGVSGYDRIIVLEGGKVVQSGHHNRLVREGGRYKELLDRQAGIGVSADGRRARLTPARLQSIPLFASLDEVRRAELESVLATERLDAGTVVVRQGDPGDRFYFVARGVLRVTERDPAGVDRLLCHLEEGDFFGEIALLNRGVRTATVTARSLVVLLSVSRPVFDELLVGYPDLRRAVSAAAQLRLDTSARAHGEPS